MIHFTQVTKYQKKQALLANFSVFLAKRSYTFIDTDIDTANTIQRLIMAYEKPDSGSLTVDGINVVDIPVTRIPFLRRQIGLIETNPILLENRTVQENIEVPLRIAEFSDRAIKDRLDEVLDYSGLASIATVAVKKIDGATRRLVALTRATIHRPGIVLVNGTQAFMDSSACRAEYKILELANHYGASVVRFDNQHGKDALPAEFLSIAIEQGKLNANESTAASDTHR